METLNGVSVWDTSECKLSASSSRTSSWLWQPTHCELLHCSLLAHCELLIAVSSMRAPRDLVVRILESVDRKRTIFELSSRWKAFFLTTLARAFDLKVSSSLKRLESNWLSQCIASNSFPAIHSTDSFPQSRSCFSQTSPGKCLPAFSVYFRTAIDVFY